MNIDAKNFRDKALAQVPIGYDWDQLLNYALISTKDNDGVVSTYRLIGLTEYSITQVSEFNIFTESHITH